LLPGFHTTELRLNLKSTLLELKTILLRNNHRLGMLTRLLLLNYRFGFLNKHHIRLIVYNYIRATSCSHILYKSLLFHSKKLIVFVVNEN
jgi:hypothetical protein